MQDIHVVAALYLKPHICRLKSSENIHAASLMVLPNIIGPTMVAAEVDVKDRGMLSKELK